MAKRDEKSKMQSKVEQPKTASERKTRQPLSLSFLLDFSFSLASLVVLLVGVFTVVLSLYHGASMILAAVRGCVAVFGFGVFFWILNYFLANQVIQAAIQNLKKARSEFAKGESTREFRA